MQIVHSIISNPSLLYGLIRWVEGVEPILFAKYARGKTLLYAEVFA